MVMTMAAVSSSLPSSSSPPSSPQSARDAPTTTPSTTHVSAYDHILAGQIAGMVGLALVHPLDTVKSRVQQGGGATSASASARLAAGGLGDDGGGGKINPRQSAAMRVTRELLKQDGARGLYRGLTAPMLAYGAINAVAFSTNSLARDALEDYVGYDFAHSVPGGVLSGAAAGLTSSFVRGPAERLKTVQQVVDCESGRFKSTYSTAMTLAREHGVYRGLFTGTGATIAREIPQCAVYFLTYDVIKSKCVKALCGDVDIRDAPYSARGASIVLAGGSAGAFQWLLTYPLDVTKSRIQAAQPGTYKGVVDCAMKSVASEGPMVLFRGLGMALLRAFPLHASIFASCEAVHATLAHIRNH